MSAFRLASSGTQVKSYRITAPEKIAVLRIKGPSSYDTNGSVLDLASGNADATGTAAFGHFTYVSGLRVLAVEAHANDKYNLAFIPGASDSPSTGTIKVRDLTAASDAEVGSTTDLSAVVWVVEVRGR